MLKVRNGRLPSDARQKLREYQDDVNAQATYPERVSRGKSKFSQRNRNTNSAFIKVRSKLTDMCRGSRRCMYCEDSVADEVEHFKPKDLYPNVVFEWMNYLYACGQCNGPKNNKFKVVARNSALVDVTRARNAPVTRPTAGSPALIDPRRENPLELMMLDVRDTFEFSEIASVGSLEFQRAEYTIEILRLNERDYLVEARGTAYTGYLDRLEQYVAKKEDGANVRELARRRRALQRESHPTVWEEMKRQRAHIPRLDVLFNAAPEALDF